MPTFRTQSLAVYAATIGAPPLAAIGTAHARGLPLHKYSDPVGGGPSGLSPEAALEVALEDVGLLFVEFPDLIPRAETLNYLRAATVKLDGADGFLYIHHWPTGWQELVFATHEAAAQYIAVRVVRS